MNERNQAVLRLLKSLENYMKIMSDVQDTMGDGYIELANSRRQTAGLLVSETILAPGSPTRMVFKNGNEHDPLPKEPFVPGIPPRIVKNVQDCWEKSLSKCISTLSALEELNEAYSSVKQLVSQ